MAIAGGGTKRLSEQRTADIGAPVRWLLAGAPLGRPYEAPFAVSQRVLRDLDGGVPLT